MNPSEIYMHHYQNSEPKFYTRVPNIIDHLTYEIEKNGEKIIKRLSVYAKELYRVIRMIASDHGKDWHSVESLAEIIGCSVGSVVNAKKELLMPMIQLEGSPLIIETKTMGSREVNGHKFATTICRRTIIDIWKWNNAFMATIKYQNKFGNVEVGRSDSPHESVGGSDSPHESVSKGTDSPGEANKNNNNKISLSKEQQPTAKADPVCSLHVKNSVVSVPSALPQEEVSKTHNFNLLSKMGFNVLIAMDLVQKYTGDELRKSQIYLEKQQKKKPTENILGYFRKILENKWYLKTP